MSTVPEINSTDYWFKVIEMLQQNWALIEPQDEGKVRIFFIDDVGGLFDEMEQHSSESAERALRKNGFKRFSDDPKWRELIAPPPKPFQRRKHPNGRIYSSGRHWI